MSRPPRADNRDRLSVRALGIASIGSATAAVITSQFWAPGTALAAAVTPVIVAIVSELLSRPAEHVSRVRTSRRAASPRGIEPPAAERPYDGARASTREATSGRRRLHLKVALLTGVIAFVIAAAALTLPELLFGKAVATDRYTTLFGGAPPREQGPESSGTTPATTPTAPAEPPSGTTATTQTPPPSERRPRPTQGPPSGQTTSTP